MAIPLIAFACALLVLPWAIGILVLHHPRLAKSRIALLDWFASGVLVGIALFHLLPRLFDDIHPKNHVFIGLAVLLAVGTLWLASKQRSPGEHGHTCIFWLFAVLALHSAAAGTALAYISHPDSLILAFIVHKTMEVFAFSIRVRQELLTAWRRHAALLGFALITPSALLLAHFDFALPGQLDHRIVIAIHALAAITLLYVTCQHLMHQRHKTDRPIPAIILCGMGAMLMALLSRWS